MAALQVENWDEDLELQGDIFSNSLGTVKTSMSSRHSIQSESNAADDEWNVPLPSNDQAATSHAVDHAKLAGIPIPANVPASALVGGSIKRLGKKRSRAHISTDDWANDLEMPQADGGRLELKHRKPVTSADEAVFDEWDEGSLGIRHAKTRQSGKNDRDSSASLMSPSMGSVNTLDDDDMNGLDLGSEQFDFNAALKRQQSLHTPSNSIPMSIDGQLQTPTPRPNDARRDDFFDGIETDFLESSKRTAHRNVRSKGTIGTPQTATRTQTTLTFNDKDKVNTKIPRPVPPLRSARLEPVHESSTPSFSRNLRRPEPTTTTAQLLRAKRSMPVLGRTEQGHFQQQSSLAAARQPFRPGPTISNKPQFHSRRDSDPHRPGSPARPSSRLSQTLTPDTPTRQRRDIASDSLAREAVAKRTVTKPSRRRNFGDGTELDLFDDLPTSAAKESRYTKTASAKPVINKMRSQPSISRIASRDKMVTPSMTNGPSIAAACAPRSPSKTDSLPRFARDTAASRIAREQKLGHITSTSNLKEKGPFSARVNWQATVAARSPAHSPSANRSSRKGLMLIKPMDKENVHSFQADAARKGMNWNAVSHCWEGNDHVLAPFEPPAPPSPPRPALISNVGKGSTAMQVVGGMVFDPTQMRWLKLGANGRSNPGSPSIETEDDPFKDIPDLEDETKRISVGIGSDAGMNEHDVMEEFDLGPAFIARQREEEAAWKSRCEAWFVNRPDEGEAWKYAILNIVRDDVAES